MTSPAAFVYCSCGGLTKRFHRPSGFSFHLAVSQSLTSPLPRYPPAAASHLPSGLNATSRTQPMCSRRLSSSLPLIASQILTLLSKLAVARSLPSALNATLRTRSVCPLSVKSSLPVTASQTLAVLSQLADARRLPSWLNTTAPTI